MTTNQRIVLNNILINHSIKEIKQIQGLIILQARETAEVRYITRDIAEGLRRPQVEKYIYLVNRSTGYITKVVPYFCYSYNYFNRMELN